MVQSRAVVIVTGAWHVPKHYERLTAAIEKQGARVICECLPSNGNTSPPAKTLDDDVEWLKTLVKPEVEQGTQLLVAVHSYGGVVASGALAEFATTPNSQKGGVIGLVYIAAFMPFEHMSINDLFGGGMPPWIKITPEGTMNVIDGKSVFYTDLTDEDAEWAESIRVQHHPLSANRADLNCSMAAWRVIPTSYLVCETDQTLPASFQQTMIDKVKAEGVDVKIYRCQAAHSPFVNIPEQVADVVLDFLQIVTGTK